MKRHVAALQIPIEALEGVLAMFFVLATAITLAPLLEERDAVIVLLAGAGFTILMPIKFLVSLILRAPSCTSQGRCLQA